ncbi:MAG TPA: hypothetical protein VMU54_08285, partial [Planctomycetota bacterium]|nr:hypothetical protein [Planctomycetota bacterium]
SVSYYWKGPSLFWARNSLAPVSLGYGVTRVLECLAGGAASDGSDTVVYFLKGGTLYWARNSLTPVLVASGI